MFLVELHKQCKTDYHWSIFRHVAMFQQVFFSGKLKKGPILAIFWQFWPFNFCKLSPHKFSQTLLLPIWYVRFVIIAHFLYLWQSLKRVTFFIFSEFLSQIYPLQICHSKNLMPNVALEFSHIFQKSVYFFRSTFGKS